MRTLIAILFFAVLAGTGLATDYVTNTISGTTSNNGGATYSVATTGSNNCLLIYNGGVLTNVSTLYIGSDGGAGYNNSLVITNGGQLFTSGFRDYGYKDSAYIGGSVNATSVWNAGNTPFFINQALSHTYSNFNFTIAAYGVVTNVGGTQGFSLGFAQGYNSSSNTLTVLTNGQLWVAAGGLNVGWKYSGSLYPGGASNNVVLINGGYVNVAAGGVNVGKVGDSVTNAGVFGNSLTITNGGTLISSGPSLIGSGVGVSSANSNSVTVGNSSTWNLGSNNLTIGSGPAAGNWLTINGGIVTNASNVIVGSGTSAYGNQLIESNGATLFSAGSLTVG